MGMLCCRHAPIEFVKIEMNCYSGLCVAINDLPQPATCQLRSNWSSLRLTRCLKAVYPLFYQQPLECDRFLNMFICSSPYLKLAWLANDFSTK